MEKDTRSIFSMLLHATQKVETDISGDKRQTNTISWNKDFFI